MPDAPPKLLPTGQTFRIRATEVHRERTGVHAKIQLALDTTLLAWGVMNTDKDEERTRLANAAHRLLSPALQEALPKDHVKHDLDIFCAQLWDLHLGELQAEELGCSEPTSVEYIAEPYVVQGGGTIIFGPPKTGKSYVLLMVGLSIQYGITQLWSVTPSRVLLVNLERSPQSVARRISCVASALCLPVATTLLTVNARGRSLWDIAEQVGNIVTEKGIDVLLLDSISRAGFGDLTENNPANRCVNVLHGLAKTWVALAHSPRASDDHLYGSIMWDAGADILVKLAAERKGEKLGIALKMTDANDVPIAPVEMLACEFDDVGITQIWRPKKNDFPELTLVGPGSRLDQLKDLVEGRGEITTKEAAMAMGIAESGVSKLLIHSGEFTQTRKQGRDQYYGLALGESAG